MAFDNFDEQTGAIMMEDKDRQDLSGISNIRETTIGPRVEMASLQFQAIAGIPEITHQSDIADLILEHCHNIQPNDVIIVAQKIVSKAENRVMDLRSVTPSPAAAELSKKSGRDPRYCQVLLDESKRVLEVIGHIIVTELPSGMVCTQAGIDGSNVGASDPEKVVLLPLDSDCSSRAIREKIEKVTGHEVAVIISDSCGSEFREGSIGMAIGFSGIRPLKRMDSADRHGRPGKPIVNVVDQLCSAASLLMGELSEGTPVVIVRGLKFTRDLEARLSDVVIPPRQK